MNPRIALVVEQLWQPVPGGSGRYIVELSRALRHEHSKVVGISARRRPYEASPQDVGLEIPVVEAKLPRRLLYPVWQHTNLFSVESMLAGAHVVHATTWAIPPTSAPLVVTVHDVAFLRDPQHFTRHGAAYFTRALSQVIQCADIVIVPSQATADDCAHAGISAESIRVIPHGVQGFDLSVSQGVFRKEHHITRPYVLWVGTREPRKNVSALLRAFALLTSHDLDLVLVGPQGWGDHSGEQRLLQELPPDRVHVVGALSDQDLAEAYTEASAFCFPSLWEGFGLPVLEAMSAGIPVVTSEGTSMAEVVGDSGLLVDPQNPEQIAQALVAAVGSEHDKMAEAGKKRAAQFTWEKSGAAHVAVYQELL